MNVLVPVRTYLGGAAQRWHRLSGNGSSSATPPVPSTVAGD